MAEDEQIHDLCLRGMEDEALVLVPQEYLDTTALDGAEGFVRERVRGWVS